MRFVTCILLSWNERMPLKRFLRYFLYIDLFHMIISRRESKLLYTFTINVLFQRFGFVRGLRRL